jgi:hypothetical protein
MTSAIHKTNRTSRSCYIRTGVKQVVAPKSNGCNHVAVYKYSCSVEATDSGQYLRAMVAITSLFTNTVVVLRLGTVHDT